MIDDEDTIFKKIFFSHEVDWFISSLATIGSSLKRSTTAINFTYKILPSASVHTYSTTLVSIFYMFGMNEF